MVDAVGGSSQKVIFDTATKTWVPLVAVYSAPFDASGAPTTGQPVQGNAASNAAAVGNPVQTGGIYEVTPATYDNNDAVPLHLDSRGNLKTVLITPDGTATVSIAQASADAVAANTAVATRGYNLLYNGATWDRDRKPNSINRLLSAAASVNNTLVKGTPGDIFNIYGHNANAAARFLKLYNKATIPAAGTDTPVMTLYLPPQLSFRFEFAKGLYFSLGIGYALTTAVADADTGVLTAADILGMNVVYI